MTNDRCPELIPPHPDALGEGRQSQCVLRAGDHGDAHDAGRDAVPESMLGTDGTLTIQVWPSYVGACEQHPLLVAFSEPDSVDYARGQIFWGAAGDDLPPELRGQIVGRALINVPPGEYTHLAYFHGPEGPCMAGEGFQLPQPMRFKTRGVFEVYPITNPHAAMAQQAP